MRRFGGTGGVSIRFGGFEVWIRMQSAAGIWLCCVLLIGLGLSPTAIAQTTVTYIHTDALGSVVAESDASGNVTRRNDYEPYGAVVGGQVTDGPGYTGHVSDSATGLSYMQQRYMEPQLGVFLSVDPVTAQEQPVGQFNRYRYANGNPYRFTDPDGRVAYQAGSTVYIPIYYQGAGATPDFIAGQVKAAAGLVTEDGTRFVIVPLRNNMYPRGNIMDVSPGQNSNTIRGEGIVRGYNGSVAHIDSTRSDAKGATLHDSLHFVPGLGDGRKSDGYLEAAGKGGGRAFTGYKPGFGKDQIMANTGGNLLKSFETSFMNHAYNGNGSEQQFKTLIEDDKRK